MGRGYTIESYKNIINYIKDSIPKAAISGDAISVYFISILFSIAITGVIYRHYFTPLIPLTTLFIGALFVINKNKIYLYTPRMTNEKEIIKSLGGLFVIGTETWSKRW